MGAIIALVMTAAAGAWVWVMFKNPETRERYAEEFRSDPWGNSLVLAWCGCLLLAFWGVFVPALGKIPIPVFGTRLELWSFAAFGAGLGFVIWIVAAQMRARR